MYHEFEDAEISQQKWGMQPGFSTSRQFRGQALSMRERESGGGRKVTKI